MEKNKLSASYRLMKQTFLDSIGKTLKNLSFDLDKTIADLEATWTYRNGCDEEITVPSEKILTEIGIEIPHYQISLLKVIVQISNEWLKKL